MTTHTDLAAQVERVELYGVKDGKQTLLGTVPMPPRMMAREIAREMFGPFEDDDGSDAELCFAALEQMIEHMGSLAALSTERLAGGGEPVAQEHIHLAWRGALMACGVGEADRNVISEVVLSMLPATPPPQAERVPLSPGRLADQLQGVDYTPSDRRAFIDGVRFAERSHGIGTPKEST